MKDSNIINEKKRGRLTVVIASFMLLTFLFFFNIVSAEVVFGYGKTEVIPTNASSGGNVSSVTSGNNCITVSPTTNAVVITFNYTNSTCNGGGNFTLPENATFFNLTVLNDLLAQDIIATTLDVNGEVNLDEGFTIPLPAFTGCGPVFGITAIGSAFDFCFASGTAFKISLGQGRFNFTTGLADAGDFLLGDLTNRVGWDASASIFYFLGGAPTILANNGTINNLFQLNTDQVHADNSYTDNLYVNDSQTQRAIVENITINGEINGSKFKINSITGINLLDNTYLRIGSITTGVNRGVVMQTNGSITYANCLLVNTLFGGVGGNAWVGVYKNNVNVFNTSQAVVTSGSIDSVFSQDYPRGTFTFVKGDKIQMKYHSNSSMIQESANVCTIGGYEDD